MPSTPAMTTGTMDFMTSSGRMTPMEAMPTPDLAVPYAAPKPGRIVAQGDQHWWSKLPVVLPLGEDRVSMARFMRKGVWFCAGAVGSHMRTPERQQLP